MSGFATPPMKNTAPSAAIPSPATTPEVVYPSDEERAMLAALPEPALLTRDHWQGGGTEIVVANAAFAALTGYTEAELPGSNTRLLHGPRTDLLAPRGARAGGSARLRQGECWLYRKDGAEFFAAWKFAPLRPGLLVPTTANPAGRIPLSASSSPRRVTLSRRVRPTLTTIRTSSTVWARGSASITSVSGGESITT